MHSAPTKMVYFGGNASCNELVQRSNALAHVVDITIGGGVPLIPKTTRVL